MPGAFLRERPAAIRGAAALVLVVVAIALIPALRNERRLQDADARLRTDPAAALREATSSVSVATRPRAAATAIAALVRLGDLRTAERLASADARANPDDTYAIRRLYQVQRLRFRAAAADRTWRRLRVLDPLYVAGTGQ